MNTSLTTKRNGRGREYDAPTKTAALMELALAGGSATQAARRLRERGTPVNKSTLERWKHSDDYARIRDEQARAVQARIAVEHEDLALKAAGVTRKLLERLDSEVADLPLRDVPGAARNTGTIAGISTDKQMLTRERPLPAPAPSRDYQEIIRALIGMRVVTIEPGPPVIESTAIEEKTPTDAQEQP
jgi:hypothetical protein